MSKKQAIVCPCSRCGRSCAEPIELNVKTKGAQTHYYACPHCFSPMGPETVRLEDRKVEGIESPTDNFKDRLSGSLSSGGPDESVHSGALHCPYNHCRKRFEKPIVLTDTTKLLRETFYACPHCHGKIDVLVDTESGCVVSIKTAQVPIDMPPAQCRHYFGYLKALDEDAPIPDECAICPKVMQCIVKKP